MNLCKYSRNTAKIASCLFRMEGKTEPFSISLLPNNRKDINSIEYEYRKHDDIADISNLKFYRFRHEFEDEFSKSNFAAVETQ